MDPFVAEIRIFAGNFAPKGWAFCNGQLLPISQNTAVFSLLGVNYGGDGKTNFGLPNLIDRAPMHIGGAQPGPGLSFHQLGESGGSSAVTLIPYEMPSHTHLANCSTLTANNPSPANNVWATDSGRRGAENYASAAGTPGVMAFGGAAGGSQPHNNMPPYIGLTFIIALQGVYPARG